MFSKTIRILYFYLISLITLFMILGGIMATVINIINVILPEKVITYNYSKYDYEISDYKTNYDEEQETRESNRRIKNLIYSLVVVGVAAPVYLYHWKKIEQDRKKEGKGE